MHTVHPYLGTYVVHAYLPKPQLGEEAGHQGQRTQLLIPECPAFLDNFLHQRLSQALALASAATTSDRTSASSAVRCVSEAPPMTWRPDSLDRSA